MGIDQARRARADDERGARGHGEGEHAGNERIARIEARLHGAGCRQRAARCAIAVIARIARAAKPRKTTHFGEHDTPEGSMVRMPVQLGATSAKLFFRGFVGLGLGRGGAVLAAVLVLEEYRLHAFSSALWLKAIYLLFALGAVAVGSVNLRRSWRTRASDAIFEGGAVRIEGGPRH